MTSFFDVKITRWGGFGGHSTCLLVMALLLLSATATWAQYAYIANANDGTVSVIRLSDNTVVGAPIPVGTTPTGVAASADGNRVYVTNEGSANVSVISTFTNTVIFTISVGSHPFGVAVSPDNSRVYVANQSSSTVSVIQASTNTVLTTIPVGTSPTGVDVSPDGSRVYVANKGSNTVSVIATASNTVIATVPVGAEPFGVAVSPDGSRVYVTNSGTFTFSFIDTSTNTDPGFRPVGSRPYGVAVTPDGSLVFIANNYIGTANAYDSNNSFVGAFFFDGNSDANPYGVATSPDGTRVYFTGEGSDKVAVFDASTRTRLTLISVGDGPRSLGKFISNGCANAYTSGPTVSVSSPICAGQTFGVTFDAADCLKAGNSFTAELSDKNGNFDSPNSLGAVTPGSATTLPIPVGTPTGSGYRVRIVSTNSPSVSSGFSTAFAVNGLASNYTSTPTVSQTPACAGASIKVAFTVKASSCPFPSGTLLTAELSDATGNFANPTTLGPVSPGVTNVSIPQSTPTGSSYRIRIVATINGSVVYSSPSAAFTVNQPSFNSTPTVSSDNKCPGQPVRLNFTAGACPFPSGNTFTAYLSDASGAFPGGGTSLGPVTPGAINNVTIPLGTAPGTTYKIRVVSSNPVVTSAASANVKVKACGNTREAAPEESGLQVRVSPNPTPDGRLRINIAGAEGQALKVALFNPTGQPVRSQAVERANEEEVLDWDISRQPRGLYLLRVSGRKESKTVKVVH